MQLTSPSRQRAHAIAHSTYGAGAGLVSASVLTQRAHRIRLYDSISSKADKKEGHTPRARAAGGGRAASAGLAERPRGLPAPPRELRVCLHYPYPTITFAGSIADNEDRLQHL
ncbi:hypothetical protein EVAR_87433_1 [Eumeta japonica]|uniref:Uncharacterized protein n=1 Tax=Eumeta variegata TaxID=151549 RepID=A0A4C1XGJ1_EUMVA|nr:hypothetical protein EVAR_87433_1 [Eumeta japonica]